jgi:hypothetical protein
MPPQSSKLPDLAENTLWKNFHLFELTEIMRQKGDLEFCTALNNMAEGSMTQEDVALIRSREIKDDGPTPLDTFTRLFWTNDDCTVFNHRVHIRLPGKMVVSTALDRVQGEGTPQQKAYILKTASRLARGDDDGLPSVVTLKEGATYFVSTNVDVEDGLFNG